MLRQHTFILGEAPEDIDRLVEAVRYLKDQRIGFSTTTGVSWTPEWGAEETMFLYVWLPEPNDLRRARSIAESLCVACSQEAVGWVTPCGIVHLVERPER